jgi:SpoIIAA-like
MAFTITDATGPVISAKISGELSKAEVSQVQAAALKAIQRWSKISALFVLENFHGWKTEGDWGDISFLIDHDKDIAKIASWETNNGAISVTPFSPRDFAKPKSNISFLVISQKRARGCRRHNPWPLLV